MNESRRMEMINEFMDSFSEKIVGFNNTVFDAMQSLNTELDNVQRNAEVPYNEPANFNKFSKKYKQEFFEQQYQRETERKQEIEANTNSINNRIDAVKRSASLGVNEIIAENSRELESMRTFRNRMQSELDDLKSELSAKKQKFSEIVNDNSLSNEERHAKLAALKEPGLNARIAELTGKIAAIDAFSNEVEKLSSLDVEDTEKIEETLFEVAQNLGEQLNAREKNKESEEANKVVEEVPVQTEETPVQTQDNPVNTQDTPAQEEPAPTEDEQTQTQEEPAPTEEEQTQTQEESAPTQEENSPTEESEVSNTVDSELNFNVPHLNHTLALAKSEGARECIKFRRDRNKGIAVGTCALMAGISLLGGAAFVPALAATIGLPAASLGWANLVDEFRKWNFNRKMINFANKCDCEVVYDYNEGNMNFVKLDEDGRIEKTISDYSDMAKYMSESLVMDGYSVEAAENEATLQCDLFAKSFKKMSKASKYDQGKDITALDLSKDLKNIYDIRFGGITNAGNLLQQAGKAVGIKGGKVIGRASSIPGEMKNAFKHSTFGELINIGISKIKNSEARLRNLRERNGNNLTDRQREIIDDALENEEELINREPSRMDRTVDNLDDIVDDVSAEFIEDEMTNENDVVQTQENPTQENSTQENPTQENPEPTAEEPTSIDGEYAPTMDEEEVELPSISDFDSNLMEDDLSVDPSEVSDTYTAEQQVQANNVDVEQELRNLDFQIEAYRNADDLEMVEKLEKQYEDIKNQYNLNNNDAMSMGR